MNNASTTARTAHWAAVERGISDALATNGLGHAVHALILPAGWTQIGETRKTRIDAMNDLTAMSPSDDELSVKEVLMERAA